MVNNESCFLSQKHQLWYILEWKDLKSDFDQHTRHHALRHFSVDLLRLADIVIYRHNNTHRHPVRRFHTSTSVELLK